MSHLIIISRRRWFALVCVAALLISALPIIAPLPNADSQENPAFQLIESDDPAIVQNGTWLNQSAPAASGGVYLYNSGEAALALNFAGPSVEILFVSGPNLGTLAIEIDGTVLRTVITTATEVRYQQSTTINYLTDENHTLKVYAQAGGVIGVDAFIVTPMPPLPDYSVRVPIQRAPRVASPNCGTPTRTRRLVMGYDGSELFAPFGINFLSMAFSDDGQYVVFQSWAWNILPNLTFSDSPHGLYRVNTQTCEVEIVAQLPNGGVSDAEFPAMSANGQYIAFFSWDSLVPADTNNSSGDVYLRDMTNATITLVSRNAQGIVANNGASFLGMSSNGRFVAFASTATNLDPTAPPDQASVYIFDRESDQIVREPVILSRTFMGSGSNYAISDDGRFVAYNIAHTDDGEIYLADRLLQTNIQITPTLPSAALHPRKHSPDITPDGRYIFYQTTQEQIVPDDVSLFSDVFMYDRITAVTHRITVTTSGTEINGGSGSYDISGDGRYVSFLSGGTNLVEPDTNGALNDVYLLDRQTGSITRVSPTYDGTQLNNDWSNMTGVSGDGRYIVYTSRASNVVPHDSLDSQDLFLVDLQAPLYHSVLTATPPTFRQVNLTWTQYAPTPTTFEIQRSPDGITWTPIATTTPGQTSYVDTTVDFLTTYYYRLRVLNLDPNYMEYTLASRVTSLDIGVHTELSVATPGGEQVVLTWTQNAPTPTTFELQRAQHNSPEGWITLTTTTLGQTSFVDTPATCGAIYNYRLRALTLDPNYTEYSSYAGVILPCGADHIALFRPEYNWVILMESLTLHPPQSDYTTYVANPPDIGQYVMGDWDGDGDDTPGVYSLSGAFWYTNDIGSNTIWTGIWIGFSGRPMLAGRFDANFANDCVGVLDYATGNTAALSYGYAFYYVCDLTHGPTPPRRVIWLFDPLGETAQFAGTTQFSAGDFDANGIDTLAARRGTEVRWSNVPIAGQSFATWNEDLHIGTPSTLDNGLFMVGDWDGDYSSEFGLLYQNGRFYYLTDYADVSPTNPQYYLQRIGQPFGTPFTATDWRD